MTSSIPQLATRTLEVLRTRLRTRILVALQQGSRWILNFGRRLKVPGNLSLFPFVHCSPKPTNGVSNRFVFAPVLSLSVLHVRNMQHRNVQDHGKSLHNHG